MYPITLNTIQSVLRRPRRPGISMTQSLDCEMTAVQLLIFKSAEKLNQEKLSSLLAWPHGKGGLNSRVKLPL